MIIRALDWLHNSCTPVVGWEPCMDAFLWWLSAYNAWLRSV